MHSAISPGSRKTYEQPWSHLLDFSTRYCGTAFPLTVSDIVLFVAYLLAKKLAPSTIWTYIFVLSYVHKIGSFSDPTTAGVANGTLRNVGLGKFWQDLEISEAFTTSLEISFLHGLFLIFLSLETFYQRVSGSDF